MEKLERNLIDNILESEVKLGCADSSITFYYPASSLTALLDCDEKGLASAIAGFQKDERNRLGDIVFEELRHEKGRYAIIIPAQGINWVHAHFQPSGFMKDFVEEIRRPGNTLERITEVFYKYSPEVDIHKISEDEWAVAFRDEGIDPYIYHIEQNVFGLEYHRFTKDSYPLGQAAEHHSDTE